MGSEFRGVHFFYDMLFSIIGWRKLNEVAYSTGESEIYFKEVDEEIVRTLGPRHICYQAINRKVVDEVAEFLSSTKIKDNTWSDGNESLFGRVLYD